MEQTTDGAEADTSDSRWPDSRWGGLMKGAADDASDTVGSGSDNRWIGQQMVRTTDGTHSRWSRQQMEFTADGADNR